MSICEKCWSDAAWDMTGDQPKRYEELVRERDRTGHRCTPEQQAGEEAGTCQKCGRRALHQWTGECMNCGEKGKE